MTEEIDLGIADLDEVRVIGSGGFSTVYAAQHRLFRRPVAVKVLRKLTREADRRRFERECEVLGRLSDHPNVVTVYHAGYTTADDPFVIMELAEGGTLGDLIEQRGTLPWREAVAVLVPICDALGRAHEEQILHRDIKPENILLSSGVPKLTDFGIAYLRDATGATSTHITASWLHTAPETFDNRRDERSDLYSLASTLFHLVTGRAPFWHPDDESLNPLIMRLASAAPPSLDPQLAPPALDDFLQRALAKDPDRRPPTAAAFAAELSRLVSDDRSDPSTSPAPAQPTIIAPSAPPSQARPSPSSQAATSVAATSTDQTWAAPSGPPVVTNDIAGPATLPTQAAPIHLSEPPPGVPDPGGERHGPRLWLWSAAIVAVLAIGGVAVVVGSGQFGGDGDLSGPTSTTNTSATPTSTATAQPDPSTSPSTSLTTSTSEPPTSTTGPELLTDAELEAVLASFPDLGDVQSFELQQQYSACVFIDGRHTGPARFVEGDAGWVYAVRFTSAEAARSVLDDIAATDGEVCDAGGQRTVVERVVEQDTVLWLQSRDGETGTFEHWYYYSSDDLLIATAAATDLDVDTALSDPDFDNALLLSARERFGVDG